jgi:phosphoglycerate-specific signal transduction histidine kinase
LKQKEKAEKELALKADELVKSEFRNVCSKHVVLTQFLTAKQQGIKILGEHSEYVIMRSTIDELKQFIERLKPFVDDANEFVSKFNEVHEEVKRNVRAKLESAYSQTKNTV